MTDIIKLQDDEKSKLPEQTCRTFIIRKPEDELVAIEKFLIIYKHAPDVAYRWRNLMYFPQPPTKKEEEK